MLASIFCFLDYILNLSFPLIDGWRDVQEAPTAAVICAVTLAGTNSSL
jgi:hypothetical protein